MGRSQMKYSEIEIKRLLINKQDFIDEKGYELLEDLLELDML